jgi:signal transduction histidine kinase
LPDFVVDLQSDEEPEEGVIGTITPQTAEQNAHYRMDFELGWDAQGRAVIKRTLHRSPEMAKQFRKQRIQKFDTQRLDESSDSTRNDWRRPTELACGPFTGRFLYNPPPPSQRAKPEDAIGHGVLLYRDGMIVEPYGLDENDWLGVEARKAQRQGHDLVQPATFWGEVHIDRDSNPDLVDMANRQGLLENAASLEFVAHLRAEFDSFERLITEELEERWEKPEVGAAKVARTQLKEIMLASRAFAHHVRQPLMGIGAELVRLETLINRHDLPSDMKARLMTIHRNLTNYLERTERLVNQYAKTPVPEFERTSIETLMAAVEAAVLPIAEEHEVELTFSRFAKREIIVPRALVQDALEELIQNAIEVDRPVGRSPVVKVTQESDRRDLIIVVEDNGQGMDGVTANTELGSVHLASTKGGQGEGLIAVTQVVTFSRGVAEVVKTDAEGTAIRVRIPGREEGLE